MTSLLSHRQYDGDRPVMLCAHPALAGQSLASGAGTPMGCDCGGRVVKSDPPRLLPACCFTPHPGDLLPARVLVSSEPYLPTPRQASWVALWDKMPIESGVGMSASERLLHRRPHVPQPLVRLHRQPMVLRSLPGCRRPDAAQRLLQFGPPGGLGRVAGMERDGRPLPGRGEQYLGPDVRPGR